ncbi:chemotaxis protein CheW [Baekduia soli]|uniref:Chemotaxis protein CheW n=1 Tax=Baekduia soli TaxID=496014 RepID=A0A5B8U1J7_9ACTN|nr:chemotaxis protein CheW [Baekduia soli]QEC46847.1 chemotaxis protein CheW [Baekduia soli]
MSEDPLLRQLVVFSLGDEEYALPITQVHEIIRFTEPRSVASSDPSVRGVISLRGRILPVYDLATRLGLDHPGEVTDAKIVIVETADDMAGVVVDDVEEVITVDLEALEDAPTAGGRAIDGIAKIGDRLVVLLDPEGIVGAGPVSADAAAARSAADDVRAAA